MTQTYTSNLELAPGCLACYTQGRLTFYWLTLTKDTTLEQIERALDVEEIHRRAKTPFVCGGEEVQIQDNDFGGGEYMTARELYGYVELLQLVPNFDYVRAFKDIYLMEDEFDVNQEPSDMFKEFADSVQVLNTRYDLENYLDEQFDELYLGNVPEFVHSFIRYSDVRESLLQDYEKTEVNNKIYLWRSM